MVDLPQVLKLANRFIKKFDNKMMINMVDGTSISDLDAFDCDLVISNYAYSELSRMVQERYYEKFIKKSKHGYFTWNKLSEEQLDGYTLSMFIDKLKDHGKEVRVLKEQPITAAGNCIVVW